MNHVLEFVTRIDNHSLVLVALQQSPSILLSKRTCATDYQDTAIVKHYLYLPLSFG